MSLRILSGQAFGPVIATKEALSFWGGVDPATGIVIDIHHPLHGVSLTGAILLMPTSRGSCSGSGVLLDMALTGLAPAALVFSEEEDVLTLGALIAAEMFAKAVPVLRLSPQAFRDLSNARTARISERLIETDNLTIPLAPLAAQALDLTEQDRAMLSGLHGEAAQQAMRIICAMAAMQGATQLVDVTQVHIDGCIYASPANLTFAERMADAGAKVIVPTTTNAISVDRAHWRAQGVPTGFGEPAARLADAYISMGCSPSFTCAPYLLDSAPSAGDCIAWAESNAVIFANTVLGARTAKHPDFLDLCIALTGRAPLSGPYLDAHREARRVIDVDCPKNIDDSFWPLIGYLAGKASPDRIPLLLGFATAAPSRDDLKALCAAFGTTSAAPMLHIAGITPEADTAAATEADHRRITLGHMATAWSSLNSGPEEIDLVAFGSPHASLDECRAIADAFGSRYRSPDVDVIITAGRGVIALAHRDGTLSRLQASGVRVLPDLCWCSISEPVFPPQARSVMTNSGKYAHYGPGLSGRVVRFGSLADCVTAALTGRAPARLPDWLADA
ncbi:cis-3-hydroxy-L-proline dehydratase [Acidisoma cellulosilyticum]|uniref:cis-3-hydroxy-L-proline dehydratase n=1 Tax=Acidisoma cellulosilyticum TaxID=2802395 RepID=UPI001D0A0A82|nr:aconitase X [Acidisoma cellulosilyticum]